MYSFLKIFNFPTSKALLLVLMLSSLLYAGGKNSIKADSNVVSVNRSGFYFGAGLGWMRLKDDYTLEFFETYPVLLLAGYRINDNFSVEARYLRDIGKVRYENGNTYNADNDDFPTNFTNMAIYLKPEYQLNSMLSIYGLLGYGEVKLTKIKGGDRHEKGFQWGAGVSYKISEHINGFADYTRIYGGKGFGGRAKIRYDHVDAMMMGVSYEF